MTNYHSHNHLQAYRTNNENRFESIHWLKQIMLIIKKPQCICKMT